jgi:hypothetical protein
LLLITVKATRDECCFTLFAVRLEEYAGTVSHYSMNTSVTTSSGLHLPKLAAGKLSVATVANGRDRK